MSWIDWLIALCPLLVVAAVGFYAQRFVKGVSDFLSAGRVAGRYVVAVGGAPRAAHGEGCRCGVRVYRMIRLGFLAPLLVASGYHRRQGKILAAKWRIVFSLNRKGTVCLVLS